MGTSDQNTKIDGQENQAAVTPQVEEAEAEEETTPLNGNQLPGTKEDEGFDPARAAEYFFMLQNHVPDVLNQGPFVPTKIVEADVDEIGNSRTAAQRLTMDGFKTDNRKKLKELPVSSLKRFHGLPTVLKQLCDRNPYGETWLRFNPEEGSLEGFMPTQALEVIKSMSQEGTLEDKQALCDKYNISMETLESISAGKSGMDLYELAQKLTHTAWSEFELPQEQIKGGKKLTTLDKSINVSELPVRIFYDPEKVPPGQPVDYIFHSGPTAEGWKDPSSGYPAEPQPMPPQATATQPGEPSH